MLVNQRIRVESDVVTRIHRSLVGKATVLVSLNQEVTPEDVIGISEVSGGFRSLDLAKILSVPAIEVKKYLQRSLGQKIFKGELLAFRESGILQSKLFVTAPTDCILDFIDQKSGMVRLKFLPQKLEIPAAVFGIVEYIDRGVGLVIIKTQATRIYGVLGSGRTREGVLLDIGSRGDLIRASKITKEHSGHILIGGGLIYKEAINTAITVGVNGIITGGINAKDYLAISGGKIKDQKSMATDVGVSILVSEGFGSVPIGEDIYNLLKNKVGNFAILDGNRSEVILPSNKSDSMISVRKVKLPELKGATLLQAPAQVEVSELVKGVRVRVIASPFMGEQGKVLFIDATPSLLESGIRTYFVTIETPFRKIKMPISNVEICQN